MCCLHLVDERNTQTKKVFYFRGNKSRNRFSSKMLFARVIFRQCNVHVLSTFIDTRRIPLKNVFILHSRGRGNNFHSFISVTCFLLILLLKYFIDINCQQGLITARCRNLNLLFEASIIYFLLSDTRRRFWQKFTGSKLLPFLLLFLSFFFFAIPLAVRYQIAVVPSNFHFLFALRANI